MTNDTNTPKHKRRIDRRTLLIGVSGALVALAGCTNKPETSDETAQTTKQPADGSDAFEQIGFNDGTLIVTLADDVSVEEVNLLTSSGDIAMQVPVVSGSSNAEFELVGPSTEGYTPGEHTLVAVSNGETIGETTLDLTPNVTLSDLRWAKQYPELEWNKDRANWEEYSALLLENTGTAPTYLTQLRWSKTPRLLALTYDTVETQPQIVLPAGETTIVYSRWPTFATHVQGTSLDCGNLDTVEFTVTADLQVGSSVSYSQSVTYGGDQYSCELSSGDPSTTQATVTDSS